MLMLTCFLYVSFELRSFFFCGLMQGIVNFFGMLVASVFVFPAIFLGRTEGRKVSQPTSKVCVKH